MKTCTATHVGFDGNSKGLQLYLLVGCIAVALIPSLLQAQDFDFVDERVTISENDLQNEEQTIYLTGNWKMSTDDSLRFAEPDYSDHHWETYSTRMGPSVLEFLDWKGVGWFRKKIEVDSSLAGEPLALMLVQHNGASQIYLNGDLLYEIGEISSNENATKPQTGIRPRIIQFKEPGVHQLAVRYANHDAGLFKELGFYAGFRLLLGSLDSQIEKSRKSVLEQSSAGMFIIGGLLAFTVIHFLFYFFYPSENKNLYFALFTSLLAVLAYSFYQTNFASSPLVVISYYRLSLVTWILTILSALLFTYSLFYKKIPVPFWFFLAVGLLLTVLTWMRHNNTQMYREIFVLLTISEMLRVLFIAFKQKKEGVWIIGTGLMLFVGAIFYSIGANLGVLDGDPAMGNIVGSSSLILAMSIYLSRSFARTNKRLQQKLREVKELSRRSLKQERVNKEKEIERKLLEAENRRKSKELEEARTLQLSMLPRKIPNPEGWDISVYMDAAHEVGGDYYDFSVDKDGVMTVAVGDATGHGMKAGIMVATAKSYFHTLADEYSGIDMIRRMSNGIKNMDLKTMFMGISLLKCQHRQVELTVAGMPPCLLYRSSKKTVERIKLKGMPLGARADFPYQQKYLDVEKGDVLLVMSDGIIELFNKKRQMLDLPRIETTLKKSAALPAEDIIENLRLEAEQWVDGKQKEDDITLVVLKAV